MEGASKRPPKIPWNYLETVTLCVNQPHGFSARGRLATAVSLPGIDLPAGRRILALPQSKSQRCHLHLEGQIYDVIGTLQVSLWYDIVRKSNPCQHKRPAPS